jgi:hypothetical protein
MANVRRTILNWRPEGQELAREIVVNNVATIPGKAQAG